MQRPLLSVIVPCYNTEKYLDKCLTSITSQTYNNLEILLIDDGSADQTGMLCDAWQAKDRRIQVIHKQNEGSSNARRTGIENATADYVTFVDADDWIDPDMYAGMMAALLSTGSDIAQCGVCEVYEDGRMIHRDNADKRGTFEVVGRVEGALLILEDGKWRSWMWNKIFKKQLFENVVFPKGRGFGDDFITLELFHKAQQTVYLHCDYYFYLQRNESITNSKSIPAEMKNQRDYFDAYFERYVFTRQYPEYQSAMFSVKYMTICIGMNILRNIIVHPQYFPDNYFYEKAEQLCTIPVEPGDRFQRSIKMNLFVLKISPKLYFFLKSLYLQILHITNKLKITNRPTTRTLTGFFGWK